jgi:hypothetical protein
MTDEEKLKDYLKRNAPKNHKPVAEATPIPKADAPPRSRSPIAFYRRKVIGEIVACTFVIFLVSFLAFGYLISKTSLDDTTAFAWVLSIAASLMLPVIAISLYYWSRYLNWINNKYYVLNGWNNFFEIRSASFWKKRMYTNVRISFKLKSSATDLHRDALLTFIKKVIKKWNKRYTQIDWEPGYGTPKDLVSDGMSFHGDISQAELTSVVKMLTSEFIPVATLLGSHLEEVLIKSQAAESERKTKKVSRNAYDRQSGSGR